MEKLNEQLTYTDVKNYWLTLFPELESMEELDEIIKNVSGVEKEDFEKFIYDYKCDVKININDLFDKEENEFLNSVSEELRDDNPFFYFFKPMFNYCIDYALDTVHNLSFIEDKDEFMKNFLKNESNKLMEFAQRTFIREVNSAKNANVLKGNDGRERFSYYSKVLLNNKDYLKMFYSEYIHLYNILIQRCIWDFKFIGEVSSLTEKHLDEIKSKLLNTDEDLIIKNIQTSLGDSHKDGKTVSMIYFTNGRKVVFKPRSLELESGFNKFIDYLNEKTNKEEASLYKTKIIEGEDYGFCEFIGHDDCKNYEDAENFYYRTGRLLGALFALNAKDIHHENIIAMGSQPVVIDLEALFHCDVTLMDRVFFRSIETAQKIIDSSVYSIGFLPQKISSPFDNDSSDFVDVSGFGGEENQKAPFKAFKVVNSGTDEMRLEKVEGFIETQNNNPRVNGKIIKSEDYIEVIKKGFSDVYDIISANKDEVINLIKDGFKGTTNRFIIRSTYIYGQLLNTSYHPDFMGEELHRNILFHRLGVNIDKDFYNIVPSEIKDMLKGDVPYFCCNIDSNMLRNSEGDEIGIEIDSSPLNKVCDKINGLDHIDKARQLHFIDMSFLAKMTNSNKDDTFVEFAKSSDLSQGKKEDWIDTACEIGDYILDKSITGFCDDVVDRTWISTVLMGRDECSWSLAPVGNSLYEGNAGIGLFLAYLGEITGEEKFKKGAAEALESIIHEVKLMDSRFPFLIGPYNGFTGYLYTLYQIYKITNDEKYLNIIKDKLYITYELIPKDKNIDVIGGCAGALGVLLSMYHDSCDEEFKNTLLDLSNLCFEHIYKSRVRINENSIAWGSGAPYVPCTGFAHGNAGIAAYLMKLYAITKNERIIDVIKEALNYERGLYISEKKNWQSSYENKGTSLAWCHGAPGILLGRLILKQCGYHDELIDDEIRNALETTMEKGFGHNPCLCHGDIGNLSIVKFAAEILGDDGLKARCENTFNSIFDKVIKERWDKGVLSGTESMGLMIGLSAFGYGLLKEIDNDLVKEILWF